MSIRAQGDPHCTSTTTATATTTSNSNNGKKRCWYPLECNPAVLNEYISKLGWDTTKYQWVDVLGTEEWALQMVPEPVAAVALVFPVTATGSSVDESEEESDNSYFESNKTSSLWHRKQTIGGACGTMAILHALANFPEDLRKHNRELDNLIAPDSWLDRFFSHCARNNNSTTSLERAQVLEADAELEELHNAAATQSPLNQTQMGQLGVRVHTRFVTLVATNNKDGSFLYELDGRKKGPVPLDPCSAGGTRSTCSNKPLLRWACRAIQETYLKRAPPNEHRFGLLALAPTTRTTTASSS